MKENFLHYLWEYRLFKKELITVSGESVQILKPGQRNNDAGPDFFNAKVKIGDTIWAGNIEIHIKTSDWNNHNHQHDKAYSNIILHVVYEVDEKILTADGLLIPTVVVKNKFNPVLWRVYNEFLKNNDWIPCAKSISRVDEFTLNAWFERMLIERMEQKTALIQELLIQNENNWEETFYQCLARNFGFKLNALPLELLSKSLPLKFLGKHKNNLLQLEAMLFGQAGMLDDDFKDTYAHDLKREYDFLKNKFGLAPIEKHLWKFARTRPVNFPTVRLAQFAELIHKSSHLLSVVIETKNAKDIIKLFDVIASNYWSTHYRFDHSSKKIEKKLGQSSVENILINTIAPFLFFYGKQKNNEDIQNRAFDLLQEIAAEKNKIITQWMALNIKPASAFQSQALIHLKNGYCSEKKCLHCGIGIKLLSNFASK